MRLFDIIKTAQQTSGTNIITLIKDILSKTDQELLDLGFTQDLLNKLKASSTKASMSDITIQDLSPLTNIPVALRPTNFEMIVRHAQDFRKGKTSDQFAGTSDQLISDPVALRGGLSPKDQTPSRAPISKPGNKSKRSIFPDTTSEKPKKTDEFKKEFNIFEFRDKSDDKNWKQLVISPKAGNLNLELVLMLSKLGIISDTSRGAQPNNNIESITRDKYITLISSLNENDWSTSLADINAEKHLLSLDEQEKLSDYAEVKARSILDDYNNQWMYLISVPNMPKLNELRQKDVIECITYAFVGETGNVNYSRELIDVSGKSIPRVRRCRPNGLNDVGTTKEGWLVRGDPSDFQRFLDICKTRKVVVEEFTEMFVSDFYDSKLYSPSKKGNIGPHNSRLEGSSSHDGYEDEEDLIAEIKLVGNAGFKNKILSKDPQKDVSRIQMYPMQVEGVEFLYSRTQAILADDTGVGKTAQAVTAAHLRLKTDTNKMNKDMKAIVLTKSTVVTQYKRDISYFTGIDIKDIYTGDELFEDLKVYNHPLDIIDVTGKILIDIPKWKWCILNYEKFAIPPRPDIVKGTIDKKQEILTHYNIIMDKANLYLDEILNNLFGAITIALNESKAKGDKTITKEEKKNIAFSAVQKYLDNNVKTNKTSIYHDISNSSWYDKKKIDRDSDEIAKATAIDLFQVVFLSSGGNIGLDQLKVKVNELIRSAKKEKETQVTAYVNAQTKRLDKTARLEVIINLLQGSLSLEDRNKLTEERTILENSKGKKDGAFSFGEDGKRNVLTTYFSALSKLGVLDVVILDEVHTVKNGRPEDKADDTDDDHDANFTTFNTQAVTAGATNVWGASATVVANKPQDLYNQLRAINHPLGDLDYSSFVSQMSGALGNLGSASVGGSIKETLIQSKVFLNRSIEDMIADMKKIDPNVVFHKQSIYDKEIKDQEITNIYYTNKNQKLKELSDNNTLGNISIYGAVRISLGIAKANATIDFAIKNLEKGERVGIFTYWQEAGEMIEKGIQSRLEQFPVNHKFFGKKVYFFRGGNNSDDRTNQMDEFMKNESTSKYAAMVISYGAGGTGLSIGNTANVVIFNDIPQTPFIDTQARGRFHRMDSQAPTSVYYMILKGTEDDQLYSTLNEKLLIAAEITKFTKKDQELVNEGFSKDSAQRAMVRRQLQMLATKEKIAKQNHEQSQADLGDKARKSLEALKEKFPEKLSKFISWYKKASSIVLGY